MTTYADEQIKELQEALAARSERHKEHSRLAMFVTSELRHRVGGLLESVNSKFSRLGFAYTGITGFNSESGRGATVDVRCGSGGFSTDNFPELSFKVDDSEAAIRAYSGDRVIGSVDSNRLDNDMLEIFLVDHAILCLRQKFELEIRK